MSNLLHFTGRVASAPARTNHGDTVVTKFVLLRNEFAGEGKEQRVVRVPFTAFGGKANTIADHVLEGDQLHVDAHIQNNNYQRDGEDVYDYNFIVEDFDFGAPGQKKRAQLEQRQD